MIAPTKLHIDSDLGLLSWAKGTDEKLSEHFSTRELECPCRRPECRTQLFNAAFLKQLQSFRTALNLPLQVTSGYRCFSHQAELNQAGYETAKLSQH